VNPAPAAVGSATFSKRTNGSGRAPVVKDMLNGRNGVAVESFTELLIRNE
jgi:hypothetical protein